MLYDAKSVDEYMQMLEHDWRKDKVIELRRLIREIFPELKEGIEYKMLSFGDGEKSVFNLNAQKNYVSLYVGNIDKVTNARTLLKEFNMGKGCIRIKKSINLEETKIDAFIKEVRKVWNSGGNTDC